ncbi:hypothetical protein K435DRAFT_608416, partial [Dendrothele bispora CBS 962.96]
LHYSHHFVPEYNNPNLICGLFPTLFPLGIGGFEDKRRKVPVSFERHAKHFFCLRDRKFRYHYYFIFVVFNILQRRKAHLNVHLTASSKKFSSVAQSFSSLTAADLNSLSKRLKEEKSTSPLNAKEKLGYRLLKEVNTVAAKIPGSQAMKVHTRNEIRSFFGYFGLPQLYFTFNPSAVHSPIFQVMYGDTSIDLNDLYPKIVPKHQQAYRLARDPVAGAEFFEFSFQCAFRYLLGWNFDKGHSTDRGGVLGKIRAFHGNTE